MRSPAVSSIVRSFMKTDSGTSSSHCAARLRHFGGIFDRNSRPIGVWRPYRGHVLCGKRERKAQQYRAYLGVICSRSNTGLGRFIDVLIRASVLTFLQAWFGTDDMSATEIIDNPFAVFVIAVVTQAGAAFLGDRLRKNQPLKKDEQNDLDTVLTATLTLLALIIGFSFSMAVSRYDQRKNYEEAEANAIGTEYIRADLLPAEDAAKVRELLKSYVDQRIASTTAT